MQILWIRPAADEMDWTVENHFRHSELLEQKMNVPAGAMIDMLIADASSKTKLSLEAQTPVIKTHGTS